MDMSFETYQLVGNEEHTPGCRTPFQGVELVLLLMGVSSGSM